MPETDTPNRADISQVIDLAIELGDLARRVRRRDENEQGLISGDIVVSGPLVASDVEGENEQERQAVTASDLLDLPHVVIWRDGDQPIVTEFAAGWPAHEFAMRKMNETPNKPVTVCVVIRELKYLPAKQEDRPGKVWSPYVQPGVEYAPDIVFA